MRRSIVFVLAVVLVLLAVAVVALILLYHASQQVPDFYREAVAVEPATQTVKSDEMVHRATRLHNDVLTEGRWRGEFTADTINAWLAVDLPANHGDSLPSGVSDPRIDIRQDELTVGCKVSRGAFHGVVWIDLGISMVAPKVPAPNGPADKSAKRPPGQESDASTDPPARIAIRIRKARLGNVPWPLDQVLKSLSEAARQNGIRVDWEQDRGDPVALVTVPTKLLREGQHVRLDAVQLEPGRIIIAGTTGKDTP